MGSTVEQDSYYSRACLAGLKMSSNFIAEEEFIRIGTSQFIDAVSGWRPNKAVGYYLINKLILSGVV